MSGQATEADRRETFLRLVAEYGAPLRRLTAAYLAHRADQEDLYQEIAAALWTALPAYRGEASERTWLYRVAHNTALSFAMRVRRKAWRESGEEIPVRTAAHEPDAAEELIRGEQRARLAGAIRELPAPDRQMVQLHLEGLSYREIGEITGISESAIGARLTRLRQKLAASLREQRVGQ